jgi:hypothetical protein
MAQLYPQAPSSLLFTFYDWQGYRVSILTRLHRGNKLEIMTEKISCYISTPEYRKNQAKKIANMLSENVEMIKYACLVTIIILITM